MQRKCSVVSVCMLTYTRQQKKRIFLHFCFTILKVILFYLLNRLAYAWLLVMQHFLVTTQFVENFMLIFCQKKAKITNFLLNVSRTQFSMRFHCTRVQHDVTGKRYKILENSTQVQFCRICKILHFSKFLKIVQILNLLEIFWHNNK